MKSEKVKIKVIFRMLGEDVLALFPEVPGTNDPRSCNSYMHKGQHGACRNYANCVKGTRAATPHEYAELAAELRSIGYELEIKTRDARAAMAKVRRGELERMYKPASERTAP